MELNLPCHYSIILDEETLTYKFTTEQGADYTIAFIAMDEFFDDTSLSGKPTFQIVVDRNSEKIPFDKHIEEAVKEILLHFFQDENRILCYVCYDGDNYGKARKRLFNYWYNKAGIDEVISKIDKDLNSGDTVIYSAVMHHNNISVSGSVVDSVDEIVYILNESKDE